jgi:hypothetical protein
MRDTLIFKPATRIIARSTGLCLVAGLVSRGPLVDRLATIVDADGPRRRHRLATVIDRSASRRRASLGARQRRSGLAYRTPAKR